MQSEFDAAQPNPPIQILGVNNMGSTSGVTGMCDGRDVPYLQDTPSENVWGSWSVTWRDVIILNGCNEVIDVYNLTDHSLQSPTNYDQLKNLLLAASAAE